MDDVICWVQILTHVHTYVHTRTICNNVNVVGNTQRRYESNVSLYFLLSAGNTMRIVCANGNFVLAESSRERGFIIIISKG